MSSTGHRAGPFKQVNKRHKTGRHRTKGIADIQLKGRKDVKALSRAACAVRGKVVRRQQAAQLRANKRNAILAEKRGIGAQKQPPPLLVTVLSLSDTYPCEELIALLCSCDQSSIRYSCPNANFNCISASRFKSRYMFVSANQRCLEEILDVIKVSDLIVFVWPLNGEITVEQDLLMSTLLSHGLPTTLHFAPGLGNLATPKAKESARKAIQKLIERWSFGDAKLLLCDNDNDGLLALRLMSSVKKRPMIIQKRRPHLLIETIQALNPKEDGSCTLKVSGYLRGPSLNVNGLVHLQGWGDFQMEQIEALTDPYPLNENKQHKEMDGGEGMSGVKLLKPDPVKQASLQSEIQPDPMDAEQTWPHDYELPKDVFESKKTIRKVPAGTSAYQAAWIVDDEGEEDGDEEGDDEDDEDESGTEGGESMMVENAAEEEKSETEENRIETMSTATDLDMTENESGADEEIDMSEVEKYRKERENAQFPDEIDTPLDIPARIRFQKYRGLKSFRTSPWDPKENLPLNYARIFKFADYRHSKKLALQSVVDNILDDENCISQGTYANIFIANVPQRFMETIEANKDSIKVLYGLLAHEQKMSLVNMVLKKHPSCTQPILNKQKLIFHVGYRRFQAQPVFSQHTNGDKFKMERFMPTKGAFVASVFAPIMFPPASVLVFREDAKGVQRLVASGGVLDVNPDRIVLKRVVLSGHPFKIFKRHAVVRYMFFNREDIEWFKPVELYTPRGRRGHIREAVGTHGHMKCSFDQQLSAMDSVMLNLYKRVFPKWSYNPLTADADADAAAGATATDDKQHTSDIKNVNGNGNETMET